MKIQIMFISNDAQTHKSDCCCDNTDLNSLPKDEEHRWILKVSYAFASRQKSGYALALCVVCKQSGQLLNAVSRAA